MNCMNKDIVPTLKEASLGVAFSVKQLHVWAQVFSAANIFSSEVFLCAF